MAPVKATDMVLKVNLGCPYCYKKVKRVLGELPQVSNQVFDEKHDTINITVCCNSEMVRDRIAMKGGKTVQEIKIKEPPQPKPKEEAKTTDNKPKGDDKPKANETKADNKSKPAPVAAVVPVPVPVAAPVPVPVPVAAPAPTPALSSVPAPAPVTPLVPAPAPVLQPAAMTVQPPMGYPYYMPAYGGYHPGSAEPGYESGYWKPVPVSDNYGYYGYDQGAVYKQDYNGNGRDHYFNEENPSACTIM